MISSKLYLVILTLLFLSSCSQLPQYQNLESNLPNTVQQNPGQPPLAICQDLASTENKWKLLSDNARHTKALSNALNNFYKDQASRKIAVFIDGTNNTRDSNTNIWKMYTLATEKACQGAPIIPYYLQGVGTGFGTRLMGSITGLGVDAKIKEAYQFIAKTYQQTEQGETNKKTKDEIYIFGFSRGAYIARSLNGLIEFAGLVKKSEPKISKATQTLYKHYHVNNDGKPNFEKRLKQRIADNSERYAIYRNREKVVVTAISVFDTVPALGLGRDDYPDNHRTNLYAKAGFHAMAINEQRNDFRPLRFSDRISEKQTLKEVWFAGAHADIGGGYGDDYGLERISRNWMLEQLAPYKLLPPNALNNCKQKPCEKPKQDCLDANPQCACEKAVWEKGELHDEFLDSNKLFGAFGIHWRSPLKRDSLHCSVIKRWNVKQLPRPHNDEERPSNTYRPENLYHPEQGDFHIEEDSRFQCPEGDDRK